MTKPHEILLEIKRIGAVLRVAAVDAATGVEVVFQAPASTGQAEIKRLAAAKLAYVQNRRG